MPEGRNHALPGATNDTWRTWLMTGARRPPADRRRMRGAHKGLKKMLIEGMAEGEEWPHGWKDLAGAMIRHAVDEAIGSLPATDNQLVKLAYFGGYSNREIAGEVGLTEATVQRRLRRALQTISEHIQHGHTTARRAVYAFLIWLATRSLGDTTHHVGQAAAVLAAATIVVTQPAPSAAPTAPATPLHATTQGAAPAAPAAAVVPPLPAPTTASAPAQPAVQVPSVQLPSVQVPPLPIPLPVQLPPVPSPPVNLP